MANKLNILQNSTSNAPINSKNDVKTPSLTRQNMSFYRGSKPGPDLSASGKEKTYAKLKKELADKSYKPNFCLIVVSRKCNYECEMCNYWKVEDSPELTYDEIIAVVDDLKRITDENIVVHIIGGETMLFPRFLEIVEYITKTGFRASISTSGSLLSKSMCERLVKSGITGVFVSIDSLDEKKHDELRGIKGAYKKVMNGLDNLYDFKKKHNSNLCIGTTITIMEKNIDDVLEVIDWANSDKKINDVFINAVMQPFNNEDSNTEWFNEIRYKDIWPQDMEKVDKLIEQLKKRKKNGWKISNPAQQLHAMKQYFATPFEYVSKLKMKCPRGDLAVEINPEGDIDMCFYDKPIGNIRKTSLYDIWYSKKMLQSRFKINTCEKNCDLVINCFYTPKNITNYVTHY
jgi:MoaA/NifB/PqqE/SkfB family radical SAM enzyme